MAITPINVGTSANDGTGDPHRTAFQKTNNNINEVTSNGGAVINVTDPVDLATKELNDALANIYASGGGATPDLQAVTDEGNETTNIVKFVVDADNYIEIDTVNRSIKVYADGVLYNDINSEGIINYAFGNPDYFSSLTNGTLFVGSLLSSDASIFDLNKIINNGIDYPLPTGASSQIATLADITGGVTDGDKGDITVSGSGTVWTVDNQAITRQKLEHIQTAHVLGRHASGTGDVQEVSPTQLRTILNVEDGAQVNNISDTNATDLTDGGDTTLHTHDSRYYTETEIDTFLNLRVRTMLNDNVDSSSVTGTVANTIFKSYLIPANTLAVGDTIDIKAVCSKTGTNANCNFRLYTNTSNSLTGASALAVHSPINSNLYLSLDRTYTLKSGNTLQSFPVSAPSITDETGQNVAISNTAFDPTVDNYFIVAIQPNNASDSFKQTLFYMTLMKSKTSI